MTTTFWTVVRLPLSGRHYDPQEVVTDGLLHASREAALAHLKSELSEMFDSMGYLVKLGTGSGTFSISDDMGETCFRVDGPDSTFIQLAAFECAYLVAQLSTMA